MNTFLPFPDFDSSAYVLDNKRLGKQRVECKQILNVLKNGGKGWAHHPAVLQWKGFEGALAEYAMNICFEWRKRGFKDSLYEFFHDIWMVSAIDYPPWIGYEPFHVSHRSNLLRKDPVFYGKYNWGIASDMPYVWPSKLKWEDETCQVTR